MLDDVENLFGAGVLSSQDKLATKSEQSPHGDFYQLGGYGATMEPESSNTQFVAAFNNDLFTGEIEKDAESSLIPPEPPQCRDAVLKEGFGQADFESEPSTEIDGPTLSKSHELSKAMRHMYY